MTRLRLLGATLGAALVLAAGPVSAHSPDPIMGGALWALDQVVLYSWKAGYEPPVAMRNAIQTGGSDSNATKASRAATFLLATTGGSPIDYGVNVSCGVNGLACFSRANAPVSFTMSFREHGHRFDWGTLRWCQMLAAPWPDGCFDVENVALDEFGHVEILGHHANYTNGSDYLDAVVQTVSGGKPTVGWNAHAYGRCDTATLQRKYDVPSWTTRYSTCLDLVTKLVLTAQPSSIYTGSTVTFTATLTVANDTSYERMANNPVSGRTVSLQRRSPGGTSWTTVATMPAGTSAGTYVYGTSPTATNDWRAVFSKPASEGLRAATSGTVRVTVSSCSRSPCPASVSGDGR
jgi:hypothetical protein